MSERFSDLKKVPNQPATRLMAMANAKIRAKTGLPANASVSDMMAALDAAGAFVDMLRLMGAALPPRERTWWACLAARDVIEPGADVPPSLSIAEAWVRKPSDDLRLQVRTAMEAADIDDETTPCGLCVLYYDDTLGPGELAKTPGPTGASQTASFAMNIKALGQGDSIPATADVLIDRALDIARGGNGQIPLPGAQVEKDVA